MNVIRHHASSNVKANIDIARIIVYKEYGMKIKNRFALLLGSAFLIFFAACEEKKLEVKVSRFERDLIKTELANSPAHYQNIQKKYPVFYPGYCRDILGIDEQAAGPNFQNALNGFIQYRGTQLLKHEVDSVFPDLEEFEQALGKAMYRYSQEFRADPIPQFVSYISEFGYAHVTYDGIVGIGLDFYLGNNYALYKAPSIEFPDFMVRKLRKEYMLANTLKAFAISKFEQQLTDKRFVAMMLFEGKMKYFVKEICPTIHDTILFGYTPQQMEWCQENEGMIWQHFASKNLLFSKDAALFMRYINDGPFTIADGVPQESAPSIAIFTGYKIIEAFVENEGIDSLKQLMDNNNWDEILKRSKYGIGLK